MNKLKLAGYAAVMVFGAIIVSSLAFADTAPLGVSCSGTPSGTNQIVWSAVATGGQAPYSFAWSGDSSISGSTASTTVGTYATNGTYTAGVTVTDASSSVATSSCTQSVTGIVPPATTSTLNVVLSVNNATGGSATPDDFTVTMNGANASPSSFAGSGDTAVVVNGGANYTVSVTTLANYSELFSGNCAGPITAGNTDSCTIAETYVAPGATPSPTPTPTSTPAPTAPRVNPPSLSIGTNGAFLARGMTVTSVASGSFQAEVWGITYTVNWSGNLNGATPFEFWYRYNEATTTLTTQLSVGDEVGVSGTVSSSTPFTVNANVVRDYSIIAPRQTPVTPPVFPKGNSGYGNGTSSGKSNGNGNTVGVGFNTGANASVPNSFKSKLGSFVKGLFNLHFGK